MTYAVTFAEADPDDVDLLGGKGAGLARMTGQGLRVPPGYIVSTAACRSYLAEGRLPVGLDGEIDAQLAALQSRSGKTFGAGPAPLLVSVRSGAPVSMPGMMDTILNLGVSRDVAVALGAATGNPRFVADLVARFHAMYADTVLDALDAGAAVEEIVATVGSDDDPGEVYDRVWAAAQEALLEDGDQQVPADPREQLLGAVEAVFRSWNTRRARIYREHHGIRHDLGTAVVVQSMVFGNLSEDSGSGVVFTRNPVTGEPGVFGEYLAHSQGEDVVSGTRTPDPVATALAPDLLAELRSTCADLERRQGDVLDIEFTVERSTLYLLQVRSAKRTPEAAVRIAVDLLSEGILTTVAALRAVTEDQVRLVQRPGFDADELATARGGDRLLTTGIGACPGQVTGRLVVDSDRAKNTADDGTPVILARPVTSPADLHGMIAAQGIVTTTGGSTSHAAVVARALGTACVVGAAELQVDVAARTVTIGGTVLAEGDPLSLDGATGELFAGAFATSTPREANTALAALLDIAAPPLDGELFGRVTLPSHVEAVLTAGAHGLVAAIDDVFAATGHLDGLVEALLADRAEAGFPRVADLVAAELTPILAEAGDREVGVRALDFLADESRELLHQTELTTRYPELSVPLGLPALVEAQLAGLARAARDSGGHTRVHLAVRHVSDPAEAALLRELSGGDGLPPAVGYLTSPRGVHHAAALAGPAEVLWLEVRALQAAVFGIPARQLLTAQPLDGYLARGLYGSDPRTTVDPSVQPMLARLAQVAAQTPACRVGLRLSGPVSESVATQLYELGFRRFAVDAGELRPLRLALGRMALTRA